MRGHNFDFGGDNNHFVSTHNATYQDNGMSQNTEKGKSEEIRKTHFTLGGQSATMMTEFQREFIKKEAGQQQNSKDTARGFQNTNFQLGDDAPQKISSSHIHYANYGGGPEILNTEKLHQLRATHFTMGDHPEVTQSVSRTAFSAKNVPYEKQAKNFQKSNFALGDGPNMYATTYNATTGPAANSGAKPAEPCENRSYKSSFDIGHGNRFNGQTQFQTAFTPKDHANVRADPKFIAKIKENHFEIGEQPKMPGQYTTNYNAAYIGGDPKLFTAKLDEARKNDL